MNEREQVVLIAELSGWTLCKERKHPVSKGDVFGGIILSGIKPNDKYPTPLYDYVNDLNAIHEAENTLEGDNLVAYKAMLTVSCNITLVAKQIMPNDYMLLIRATAAQRAEAFLRVFNKWKE